MSLTEDYDSIFRITEIGKVYTFDEAIEYLKFRDKYSSNQKQINWVDAKTGKPVYIGYNN